MGCLMILLSIAGATRSGARLDVGALDEALRGIPLRQVPGPSLSQAGCEQVLPRKSLDISLPSLLNRARAG